MSNFIYEAFEQLHKLCETELLEESAKTDFRNKFGQETLNNFDKAKQRLINNGYSTDYGQYLKMSPNELNTLILSLYDDKKDAQRKRQIQGKDKEIRGKYTYIGEHGGYKIYEPLDVQASMDLGVNTGWCTTGRYGHYGHPEFTPSIQDAKAHWDDYKSQGIRLFYFLDPRTMYGEYAIAVYPEIRRVGKKVNNQYIIAANFELFNAKDESSYVLVNNVPIKKLPVKLELQSADIVDGLYILNGSLVKVEKNITDVIIPDSVTTINNSAFSNCILLESITIPNNVTKIGNSAFFNCASLQLINIPASVTEIGAEAFSYCDSLQLVIIPNSVTKIGKSAFYFCNNLELLKTQKGSYAEKYFREEYPDIEIEYI